LRRAEGGGVQPMEEPILTATPEPRSPEFLHAGNSPAALPPIRLNIHAGMLADAPLVEFQPAPESHLLDLNASHETPAEEFRTLAHEFAHELLHRGERRNETTRRSRELEAESVAFVVCSAIGLDAKQTSTDYIHLYRGDRAALFESLQYI